MCANRVENTPIESVEAPPNQVSPSPSNEEFEPLPNQKPDIETEAPTPDPVSKIGVNDWIFIALAWLWLSYLAVITIDEFIYPDPVWNGFDYLPVLAGFPILCLGWPVSRLSQRLETAFKELRSGAGIVVKGDVSKLIDAVNRRKRYARIICSAGLFIVLGAYFFWLIQSGNFSSIFGLDSSLSLVLMVPISVGIGSFIGFIFGGLYGSLTYLTSMKEIGASFARTDTAQARESLSTMSKIVGFTLLLTLVLCHWFIGWFIFWGLGFEDGRDYRLNYGLLFVALLGMSFLFYIFVSVLPTLSFRQQVKGLILEPAVFAQLRSDLDTDIQALKPLAAESQVAANMEADLQAMKVSLNREPEIQWLPNRFILIALAIWIAAWIPLGYLAVTQQQAPASAAQIWQSGLHEV
ncbi:MAG: hypothetical protein AAGA53_01335 [Pseudomonadota bacterium]